MSTAGPFSPPGDGPLQTATPPARTADAHLEVATGTLFVMGIAAILLAQAMPLVGGPGMATDPDFQGVPWVFGVVMGGVAGAFILVPGLIFIVAAAGIARRRLWGWMIGLVAFGIMAGFCNLPLALHGFYALLRPDVRERFT